MLPPSDDRTWKSAKQFFSKASLIKDTVHKLHRSNSLFWKSTQPILPHSFIQLNDEVYELMPGEKKPQGKIAGKGGFARVKYLYDRSGKRFTVKIDLYKGAKYDLPAKASLETEISQDVGLFLNVGYRSKAVSSKRLLEKHFRYAVMPDLGTDLSTYLSLNKNISKEARLHLAFQACFLIYSLHEGLATQSAKPVIHGDIKPLNFLYDKETGKLSLGDYGLSQYGPIDRFAEYNDGTPSYMPYVYKSDEIKKYRLNELDIFALKRSVFYPLIRTITGKGVQSEKITKPFSILDETQLDSYGLREYFFTSPRNGEYHSPLFLSSICLLTMNNLSSLIPQIEAHEDVQKAIVVLHFANMLTETNCQILISDPALQKKVGLLIPIANQISAPHLEYALNNEKVYQLLSAIAVLPYKEKKDYINKFNRFKLEPDEKISVKTPPAKTNPDVIVCLNALIKIIERAQTTSGTPEVDFLAPLKTQQTLDGIQNTFHEVLNQLDEKTHAYFLILLARQFSELDKDASFLKTLSEEVTQCFKACYELSTHKLFLPKTDNENHKSHSVSLEIDKDFIQVRDKLIQLFIDTANKEDLSMHLTKNPKRDHFILWKSHHPSLHIIEQVLPPLQKANDINSLMEQLEIEMNHLKALSYSTLISINQALHDKLDTVSFTTQFSNQSIEYLLKIARIIDHADYDYFALQPKP